MQENNCQEQVEVGDWGIKIILIRIEIEHIYMILQVL